MDDSTLTTAKYKCRNCTISTKNVVRMIARTNVDSTRYWIHIHDDEDLSALVTRLCTLYPDEWQSEITYKVYVDVGGVYYGVESAFWLRDRDHILVTTIDDVSKIPDIDWNSVGARLRPEISLLHYQEEGVKRLISMEQQHGGGILADEMGLGKTLQMLSLVIRQQPKLNISAKTLIIVPSMGVADHWAHEIRTKTTEGSLPYTVYRPENLSMVEQNIFKVVITTYDRIRSEYAKQGTGHNMSFFFTTKWFRVVLDESNKLRNLRTKLAHAIQSLDARYRWCISGTPFQNNLNELVPVFDFLRVRYDKTQAHDPEYTRILLSMYMLRRCKKDVQNDLAIKPRQEERVILEFSEPERALYDYLERILYKQLRFQDDPESDSCLASSLLYLRLKQACAHHMMLIDRFPHLIPMAQKESDEAIREMMNANAMVHKGRTDDAELAEICDIIKDFYDQCDDEESSPNVEEMQKLPHITHSTKVKWLVKFLRDTLAKSKEEKVVVVSQFVDFLEIISKVLSQQDIIHGTYNGSMNNTQRRNAFDLFIASPTNRVLLLSLKAGGVGLNLQCANHMVILDRWWNPATMDQAVSRIHRMNQSKQTYIHTVIIKDTVEETLLDTVLKKKNELFTNVVETRPTREEIEIDGRFNDFPGVMSTRTNHIKNDLLILPPRKHDGSFSSSSDPRQPMVIDSDDDDDNLLLFNGPKATTMSNIDTKARPLGRHGRFSDDFDDFDDFDFKTLDADLLSPLPLPLPDDEDEDEDKKLYNDFDFMSRRRRRTSRIKDEFTSTSTSSTKHAVMAASAWDTMSSDEPTPRMSSSTSSLASSSSIAAPPPIDDLVSLSPLPFLDDDDDHDSWHIQHHPTTTKTTKQPQTMIPSSRSNIKNNNKRARDASPPPTRNINDRGRKKKLQKGKERMVIPTNVTTIDISSSDDDDDDDDDDEADLNFKKMRNHHGRQKQSYQRPRHPLDV